MLKGTPTYFLLSIVAVLAAFTGALPEAATIAKLLFFVCVVLFVACLAGGAPSVNRVDPGDGG